MKVLFLDIDGVLNSRVYDGERDWRVISDIDETRMPLVKRIVDETGAKIVLTTTWRTHWDPDADKCDGTGAYITQIFKKFGLEIFGKTPDLGRAAERGKEVKAWLADAESVESFVILDDCRFGWDGLDDRLIKTDFMIGRGLGEEHVTRAIALLNNLP